MKKKKTGGRVAGTPNKRSIEALEVFNAFEFCPLENILKELQSPVITPEMRLGTCLKLMEFKFPRRKAIEHTLDPSSLNNDDLLGETRRILQEIEGAQND